MYNKTMSTWWDKQEGLARLSEMFKQSENEYIIGDTSKRHSPAPPMSPFGDTPKESDGKENE